MSNQPCPNSTGPDRPRPTVGRPRPTQNRLTLQAEQPIPTGHQPWDSSPWPPFISSVGVANGTPDRPNTQQPRPNTPGPQPSYNPHPRPSHTATYEQRTLGQVRSGTPPPPPGRERLQGRTQLPHMGPARSPPRTNYTEVHALLFYLAEDDLGVEDEVLDLEKVFANIYQFESVFVNRISSQNSQASTEAYLRFHLRYFTKPDDLVIVYYGGHGGLDDGGRYIWSAYATPRNNNTPVPVVKWHKIQPMLQQSQSDVLILIDACFAAGAGARSVPCAPDQGTTEIIAASGMEKTAFGPSVFSFTHALMHQLYVFANHDTAQVFSVTVLHQALLSNIISRPASHRQTPVYIRLDDGQRPSISLQLYAFGEGTAYRNKQMAKQAALELWAKFPDSYPRFGSLWPAPVFIVEIAGPHPLNPQHWLEYFAGAAIP